MGKNIGYHTRRVEDGTKVTGGSFGGAVDMETANRLVNAHFEVVVQPSGRPVFVDKQGRNVCLYVSIDPATTTKGMVAIKAHYKEQARQEALNKQKEREELEELLADLEPSEAIRRLRNGT